MTQKSFEGNLVRVEGKKLYFYLHPDQKERILYGTRTKTPTHEGYIVVSAPAEYPEFHCLLGRTCNVVVSQTHFCFYPRDGGGKKKIEGTRFKLSAIKETFDDDSNRG